MAQEERRMYVRGRAWRQIGRTSRAGAHRARRERAARARTKASAPPPAPNRAQSWCAAAKARTPFVETIPLPLPPNTLGEVSDGWRYGYAAFSSSKSTEKVNLDGRACSVDPGADGRTPVENLDAAVHRRLERIARRRAERDFRR